MKLTTEWPHSLRENRFYLCSFGLDPVARSTKGLRDKAAISAIDFVRKTDPVARRIAPKASDAKKRRAAAIVTGDTGDKSLLKELS